MRDGISHQQIVSMLICNLADQLRGERMKGLVVDADLGGRPFIRRSGETVLLVGTVTYVGWRNTDAMVEAWSLKDGLLSLSMADLRRCPIGDEIVAEARETIWGGYDPFDLPVMSYELRRIV